MAFFTIFLSLLLLLPILFSFNLKKKNLNQPPGPPKLPIIGNLHQLGELPHRSLRKLAKRYGPIMFLQLGKVPTVVISSPEFAEQILKTHDLECCSRPPLNGMGRYSYNFLDVAFTPYGDYWREMRKISVIELFSVKKVRSFSSAREKSVASFIDFLSQSGPNPVNISEKIFGLFYDIICHIACGRSFEGKQFNNRTLESIMLEVFSVLGHPSAADFIPYMGWIIDIFSGYHARRERSFHIFDEFYQKVVDEHLDPHRPIPEHKSIVDSLVKLMKNQPQNGGLSQDHIKAILMDVFLGAIDTSSITVVWAMTELMKNPRVMNKLQHEIRSSVGKLNKPFLEEKDCENIKYLKMVIKETLRLHPPAVLLLPHFTVRHIKLGGYDIYPNTRIQINAFAIARDPGIWKNNEEFYPERFEDEQAIDLRGQSFEMLPFGGGRRICPGIVMAFIAVEFVLGNLLYHFDWELPTGMDRKDISMEEEFGLTVHKKTPLILVPVKYNWN